MNLLIGLCQERPIPKWPNTLKNQQYQISLVDVNIPVSHPDIVFQNKHANHAIFVDCKSNTIKRKQVEKYDKIRKNPKTAVINGIITIIHEDHLKLDPVLCSFSDLSNNQIINEFNMLFLHVVESGKQYFEIKEIQLKKGEFSYSRINRVFPIDTSDSVPPYYLYPFDDNDMELFSIAILQYLQKFGLSGKRFTIDKLLENCHKMWKFIDHKEIFRNKAQTILTDLQKRGLKNLIRNRDEWYVDLKPDSKSHQAFQKKCIQIERQISKKDYQEILIV